MKSRRWLFVVIAAASLGGSNPAAADEAEDRAVKAVEKLVS